MTRKVAAKMTAVKVKKAATKNLNLADFFVSSLRCFCSWMKGSIRLYFAKEGERYSSVSRVARMLMMLLNTAQTTGATHPSSE